jgi:hypothetical protein
MDKDVITEIVKNVSDKTNKDLLEARTTLLEEFTKTKELIIELTRHLEIVEEYYETINKEIGKRLG